MSAIAVQCAHGAEARDENLLLVFSQPEEREVLQGLLGSDGCGQRWAVSLNQALAQLREHPATVIVCERNLPDGTWQDLWEAVRRPPNPPLLIVAMRDAGGSPGSEVIHLGGYDVVSKPLNPQEVQFVIKSACMTASAGH